MADDDTTGAGNDGERTFTRAEMAKFVNAQVKEKLREVREQYADYDDLKTKAGEADKSKTQLDKLLEKVSGLETRATKAEATALRADVAQAKGLTPAQAKRLHGATKAELEADADELKAMFKPADKDGKDDDKDGDGSGKGESKPADTGTAGSGTPASTRTRPREALRSGAAVPTGGQEETDPMKLAAMVPRL